MKYSVLGDNAEEMKMDSYVFKCIAMSQSCRYNLDTRQYTCGMVLEACNLIKVITFNNYSDTDLLHCILLETVLLPFPVVKELSIEFTQITYMPLHFLE